MNFKRLLLTISILMAFTMPAICAEVDVADSTIKRMIAQYKAGNYTGCLQSIDAIWKLVHQIYMLIIIKAYHCLS